jgi:hypothetical protein
MNEIDIDIFEIRQMTKPDYQEKMREINKKENVLKERKKLIKEIRDSATKCCEFIYVYDARNPNQPDLFLENIEFFKSKGFEIIYCENPFRYKRVEKILWKNKIL